jgi:hypothetical protein
MPKESGKTGEEQEAENVNVKSELATLIASVIQAPHPATGLRAMPTRCGVEVILLADDVSVCTSANPVNSFLRSKTPFQTAFSSFSALDCGAFAENSADQESAQSIPEVNASVHPAIVILF